MNLKESGVKKALEYWENDKLDKAKDLLLNLLDRFIEDPDLCFYIGQCFLIEGRHGLAANMFLMAIIHSMTGDQSAFLEKVLKESHFHEAYEQLAVAYHKELQNGKAEICAERAIQLKPDDATAWNVYGTLVINNGTPKVAIERLRKSLELDPDHLDANYNIGVAQLEDGDFEHGWDAYNHRFKSLTKMRENHWYKSNLPWWDGEPKGKRIVAYGEQGLGDEILFCTILPDLVRDCEFVLLDLNHQLDALFKRSFPEVTVVEGRPEGDTTWADQFNLDYKIPIGNLGGIYRRSLDSFPEREKPLLYADPKLMEKYKARMGPGVNIAVAWMGGVKDTRIDLRSIELPKWGPILSQNATFHSLQYHPWAMNDALKHGVKWYPEAMLSMDEKAALIMNCDLVISVCQSAIHLAGALDKECWVLTPSRPAWRYLTEGPMPWYSSVKLYRQKKDNWEATIKNVAYDLKRFVRKAA